MTDQVETDALDIGDVYACPKCGPDGYYNPPYNTPDECMACRWQREHPYIMPEVDRLRAVIENAPHSAICDSYEAKPCTCWKSRA